MTTHKQLASQGLSGDQRSAMIRVFGGTALAFIVLFITALTVHPDMVMNAMRAMQAAMP